MFLKHCSVTVDTKGFGEEKLMPTLIVPIEKTWLFKQCSKHLIENRAFGMDSGTLF